MSFRYRSYLIQHRTKVFVAVENNDRDFGISPASVAEQLVDGFGEDLSAAPELAFSYENIDLAGLWPQQVGVGVEVGLVGKTIEGTPGFGDGSVGRQVGVLAHDLDKRMHAGVGRGAAVDQFRGGLAGLGI